MQPIVDRLEVTFGDGLQVERLNAVDGDIGQAAFESLRLPGHPSVVLFLPDGTEQIRLFGVVSKETLMQEIQASIDALAAG
jgi:hypothetical protein